MCITFVADFREVPRHRNPLSSCCEVFFRKVPQDKQVQAKANKDWPEEWKDYIGDL